MIAQTAFPPELTLRQALMHQLMLDAVQQGQTGIVSQLLELNDVCISIDFIVTQYYDRLWQLEEALDLLLNSLQNAHGQRLSTDAIAHLVEPIRRRLEVANGEFETLDTTLN
jgi:hypothetical protein